MLNHMFRKEIANTVVKKNRIVSNERRIINCVQKKCYGQKTEKLINVFPGRVTSQLYLLSVALVKKENSTLHSIELFNKSRITLGALS